MPTATTKIFTGANLCGYCATGSHDYCPRVIRNGSRDIGPHLLQCPCEEEQCNTLRCIDCRSESEVDVNPETWLCFDRDACAARVQKRLDENPLVQKVMRSKENAMAEKAEQKAAKAASTPKEPTYCIVTGKETKGGKFAPGMDARYVSNQVAAVIGGDKTKTAALKEFKDHGLSDTLIAKFEKNLGLAQEREEKKAKAAKEKAEAKAAAKAEKEKAKADAKASK